MANIYTVLLTQLTCRPQSKGDIAPASTKQSSLYYEAFTALLGAHVLKEHLSMVED